MIAAFAKFIICALIILFAGSRLSKYGDIIAEKLGLTRAWIGLVLLATITSMPELANSIGAVTYAKMPDLAVADLLGACLFNMLTLAMLDILYKQGSIFTEKNRRHIVPLAFAALLMGLAALGIFFTQKIFPVSLFGIGLFSFLIFVVYIVSQRILFKYEKESGILAVEPNYANISLKSAYAKFFMFALLVIAAGTYLPQVGTEIITATGWAGHFVGSLFLGLATTLPELVVSASALYLGFADIAIGNLIGSNIFNVSIVFVAEIFYRKGPIFAHVSFSNIVTALSVILLYGIAALSIVSKQKKVLFKRIDAGSLAIIIVFILTFYALFRLGIN